MITATKSPSGQVFGYDPDAASQALAVANIAAGHVQYAVPVPAAPTPAQLLAAAQFTALSAMDTAFAAASVAPMSYTSAGGITKIYQVDSTAVYRIQAALSGCLQSQATPSGFYWVSLDNTQVPFSYADLLQFSSALFAQGAAAFQRAQVAKASIRAATTPAAVQAVTY